MKLLEIRDAALSQGLMCDHCLGRQVSLKFLGEPCERIGAALRAAKNEKDVKKNISKKLKLKNEKNCLLCKGFFTRADELDEELKKKSKAEDFSTFLSACRVPKEIATAEDKFWEKTGTEHCEPLKRELNRVLGQKINKIVKKANVNYSYPDIIFLTDFVNKRVEVTRNPLFIYGKYKKYAHIPQTKWPCRECRGSGRAFSKQCENCKGTGKQYAETVEELIAAPALQETRGRGSAMHGMGREDIDARMLGDGRPFVLEIRNPEKRGINLKKLEKTINTQNKGKIAVSGLRASSMLEVREIKKATPDKTYECTVDCEGATAQDLKKLEKYFKEKEIRQRTPTRVLHRRADKTRKRVILFVKCALQKNGFSATVKTQAGTYIKELVSGDEERTQPSFASVLKKPCKCSQLDVTNISEEKQ